MDKQVAPEFQKIINVLFNPLIMEDIDMMEDQELLDELKKRMAQSQAEAHQEDHSQDYIEELEDHRTRLHVDGRNYIKLYEHQGEWDDFNRSTGCIVARDEETGQLVAIETSLVMNGYDFSTETYFCDVTKIFL